MAEKKNEEMKQVKTWLITVKVAVDADSKWMAGDLGLDKIAHRNYGSITVKPYNVQNIEWM